MLAWVLLRLSFTLFYMRWCCQRNAKPKMGKAALKRAKKAAATAASAEQNEGPKCATCNETFPSRGKLFKHLEDPDNWCEPALKSATSGGGKGKKAKGKGKK